MGPLSTWDPELLAATMAMVAISTSRRGISVVVPAPSGLHHAGSGGTRPGHGAVPIHRTAGPTGLDPIDHVSYPPLRSCYNIQCPPGHQGLDSAVGTRHTQSILSSPGNGHGLTPTLLGIPAASGGHRTTSQLTVSATSAPRMVSAPVAASTSQPPPLAA